MFFVKLPKKRIGIKRQKGSTMVSGHFAESHFAENVILGGVIHNAGQFFGETYRNHQRSTIIYLTQQVKKKSY
jgi:hypothetical protein